MHPEYSKWIGRWMRNFFVIVFLFIVAIIVTEYLWQVLAACMELWLEL